jgi:pilus assembly protein CpaB
MQLTQKKTLYIAIGCAVLAMLLTSSYLAGQKRKLLNWSEPITVLVATRDILENIQINEEMVKEEYVPRKFVQPGALEILEHAVGRVTVAPVRKGEQVTDTKLVTFGRESGLAVKLPQGKRAVTIAVDDVTGVAGTIKPENFVDVLATFDFGSEASAKIYTYTILEAVHVLAVGDDMGAGNMAGKMQKKEDKGLFGGGNPMNALGDLGKKKTVTLALSPEDVQKVVLAQESGTVTLSLRPQWEEDKRLNLEAATPASVTGMRELLRARNKPVYREYRGK